MPVLIVLTAFFIGIELKVVEKNSVFLFSSKQKNRMNAVKRITEPIKILGRFIKSVDGTLPNLGTYIVL